MSSPRENILSRVRSANKNVTPGLRVPEYDGIERRYRQTGSQSRTEVIECFIDRLQDYGSGVHRCSQSAIAGTIASLLEQHGIDEMLVSSGVPPEWLPLGVTFLEDRLTYGELDGSRGTLTGCAAAIALTGSIILHHTQERRAMTLIPDYHLCVVFEDQVSETVPEAIRKIAVLGNAPITTIAGPSATADIEMTRIKGVHGPRFLDVILAGG
jgi:L-lactate dehydrogenase complex protein LldG